MDVKIETGIVEYQYVRKSLHRLGVDDDFNQTLQGYNVEG